MGPIPESPPSVESSSRSSSGENHAVPSPISETRKQKNFTEPGRAHREDCEQSKTKRNLIDDILSAIWDPPSSNRGGILAPCTCVHEQRTDVQQSFYEPPRSSSGQSSPRDIVESLYGSEGGKHDTFGVYSLEKKEEPKKRSFLQEFTRSLTACTGAELPNMHMVKDFVNSAVIGDIEGAQEAFQRGQSSELSNIDSFEDDDMQMRRLASWGTYGTLGTIGTTFSDTKMDAFMAQFDDDGNPIDQKLVERMAREKRAGRRKRLVKFDYPPISSMRQCPRTDPKEIPRLFFTEEELDQIEDDRISTYVADDVEVVAVASSLSEDPGIAPPAPPSPFVNSPAANEFNNYIGTPVRKDTKKKPQRSRSFSFHEGQSRDRIPTFESDSNKLARRRATPYRQRCATDNDEKKTSAAKPPAEKTGAKAKAPTKKSGRLVKTVQIYLRERSRSFGP